MLQNFSESDRAVSPVIGVILMVAITVILAAVVATFVLDMSDDVGQKTPTVKGQVSDSSSTYTLDTTGNVIDIAHEGGAELKTAKMKVVIRDTAGSPILTFGPGAWDGQTNGDDAWELQNNGAVVDGTGKLEVGDTLTVTKSADNTASASELEPDTEYEVQVIHSGTDSIVIKSDVLVG